MLTPHSPSAPESSRQILGRAWGDPGPQRWQSMEDTAQMTTLAMHRFICSPASREEGVR